MPWWGYVILFVCSGLFVWISAMVLSDTDDVLEPKKGEEKRKK